MWILLLFLVGLLHLLSRQYKFSNDATKLSLVVEKKGTFPNTCKKGLTFLLQLKRTIQVKYISITIRIDYYIFIPQLTITSMSIKDVGIILSLT